MDEPPTRLCCGQKHWETQCTDGKVMCCLCFNRFEVSELSTNEKGITVDVCKECDKHEKEMMRISDE